MRKPDGGLRALLRAKLSHVGHWISVETGGTDQGVPDMNLCCGGLETWIECKQTSGYAVKFQPQQVGWILSRQRRGGRCLIAVRRRREAGPRTAPCDELWIVRGGAAAQLQVGGLSGLEPSDVLGSWAKGPGNWDWTAIESILRGRRKSEQQRD